MKYYTTNKQRTRGRRQRVIRGKRKPPLDIDKQKDTIFTRNTAQRKKKKKEGRGAPLSIVPLQRKQKNSPEKSIIKEMIKEQIMTNRFEK